MLNSNIFSRCPQNMVNFDPLAAEISPVVWGTPANFNGFASWQRYCTVLQQWATGRQPNFAALNRGRHLYSAGRPSRWASVHILVSSDLVLSVHFSDLSDLCLQSPIHSRTEVNGECSRNVTQQHGDNLYRTVGIKI